MDILTLRSVVSATSRTIYCNLSVLNQVNETISSGIANFTDGNHIQIDFYDSGDGNDQNEVYLDESWLPNSTDWFYISVSDCTEIDAIHLGEKSVGEYRDFPSYEATPSIFLYQAFFRHVGRILSDDPFDATELASREISLCRLDAHDLEAQEAICVFNASKIKGKTEIFPDLNRAGNMVVKVDGVETFMASIDEDTSYRVEFTQEDWEAVRSRLLGWNRKDDLIAQARA